MHTEIQIGFSPCPNDTFIFDALVHKRIPCGDYHFTPILEDVETLNRWAQQQKLTVSKLSYHGFLRVADKYVMSKSGGALGFGVGPLLITNPNNSFYSNPDPLVLIPGEFTTAHLLFTLAYPQYANKRFVTFDRIEQALLSGDADAGVIIHENRFTYAQKGLKLISDLGQWWEKETNLPIPLGGIAISRELPFKTAVEISHLIRESITYAFSHPEASASYVKEHAQEMDEQVRRKHIDLYVNAYSLDLGELGLKAVQEMADRLKRIKSDYPQVHDLFI